MALGPEHKLQVAVKKWVRESVLAPHVFLAFDRTQKHSMLQHIAEKNRGVRAGTPDLCLLIGGAAVWTELKAPKGVVSDAQITLHQDMDRAGFVVSVVRSVREYADDLTARHVGLARGAVERADGLDRGLAQERPAPGGKGRRKSSKPMREKPEASRIRAGHRLAAKGLFLA